MRKVWNDRYPTITCQYCGEEHLLSYNDETVLKLIRQIACHMCGYWLDREAADKDPDGAMWTHVVTEDWEHYIIADEDARSGPRGSFRGFGGSPFWITWFDVDREPTYTTNLWGQSEIPEIHRHRFEVNGTVESARKRREP